MWMFGRYSSKTFFNCDVSLGQHSSPDASGQNNIHNDSVYHPHGEIIVKTAAIWDYINLPETEVDSVKRSRGRC